MRVSKANILLILLLAAALLPGCSRHGEPPMEEPVRVYDGPVPTTAAILHELDRLERYHVDGDSLNLAYTYGRLACLTLGMDDYRSATILAERSYGLFQRLGRASEALDCNPYLPLLLYRKGERTRAVELNTMFVHRLDTCDNSLLLECALRNQFRLTGQRDCLRRAYALARQNPRQWAEVPLYEAMLSDVFDIMGQPDSALYYARRATAGAKARPGLSERREINRLVAQVMANCDQKGRAYDHLEQSLQQADSLQQLAELYHPALDCVLSRIDMQGERYGHGRQRLWMVLTITLLALVIAGWVWHKTHRAVKAKSLRRQRDMQQKLEINSVAFMAKSLAMKETAGMSEKFGDEIKRMQKENKLSDDASARLTEMLKVSSMGNKEWATFMRSYESVNPRFMENLRNAHPNLGQNYRRLALLIRMGMNSNQIATLLKVKPESVHQSRWRLRRKLGADAETSIEEWLKLYD